MISEQQQRSQQRRNNFTEINEKSIFSAPQVIEKLLQPEIKGFQVTNFWEDYGFSRNDNRFKCLDINQCFLTTKEELNKITLHINEKQVVLQKKNQIGIIEESQLILQIQLMLLGIEGEIFQIDSKFRFIIDIQFNKTVKNIQFNSLCLFLEQFLDYGTYFLRMSEICKNMTITRSDTSSLFFTSIKEYLDHYRQNILRMHMNIQTILQIFPVLKNNFKELEFLYQICCPDSLDNINFQRQSQFPLQSIQVNDLTYQILMNQNNFFHTRQIFEDIFVKVNQPLFDKISEFIFIGRTCQSTFNSDDCKNEQLNLQRFKYKIEFLSQFENDILQCGNNNLLIEASNTQFKQVICDNQFEKIVVFFEYSQLKNHINTQKYIFQQKMNKIEQIILNDFLQKQDQEEQLISQKIEYINKIRQNYELKLNEQLQIKKQQQIKKEEQLRIFEDEIQIKKIRKKYDKLIQIEIEKSFLLDQQVIAQKKVLQREKWLIEKDNSFVKIKNNEPNINYMVARQNEIEQEPIKYLKQWQIQNEQAQQLKINMQTNMDIEQTSQQQPYEKEDANQQKNDQIFDQNVLTNKETQSLDECESTLPTEVALNLTIRHAVNLQFQLQNKALLHIIFQKLQFKKCLDFMKLVMFCKRGDKIDFFIDALFKENGEIQRGSLTLINSLFDDINTLDMQPMFSKKENQQISILPNLISMNLSDYLDFKFNNAPHPLNNLFSYKVLDQYMKIFAFLLKFRFIASLMRKKWKIINNQIIIRKESQQISHLAQMTRHQIQKFIDQFQYYIYTFIIEKQSYHFDNEISKAKSFIEVKNLLENYLETIIQKSFVNNSNKITDNLQKIFLAILEFNGIINLLVNSGSIIHDHEYHAQNLLLINKKINSNASIFSKILDTMINKN